MIPRIPADIRDEIVRLRAMRSSYLEIARAVGVHWITVRAVCGDHFSAQVKLANAALMREVAAARAEMATAPLFHPVDWA